VIRRGQIWWVDFGEPRGSEPGFRHPALVIQRDWSTRVGSPPSSLRPDEQQGARGGAGKQIATLNESDPEELAGTLPRHLLQKVESGLRWFLQLEDPTSGGPPAE
jgi:mRNA interferase MazF